DAVDDQRVAFPAADRVPDVCLAVYGIARGVRTPIHIDLTPDVSAALVDDHDAILLRQLDHFHWKRSSHQARSTRRKTISFGIEFRQIDGVVVVNGGGPGLKGNVRLRRSARALVAPETFGH